MELRNADTLRWHVYEILTNDVSPGIDYYWPRSYWRSIVPSGRFYALDVYISAAATPILKLEKIHEPFNGPSSPSASFADAQGPF